MPLMCFLKSAMSFNSDFHKKNTKKKFYPIAYSLEKRAASLLCFLTSPG